MHANGGFSLTWFAPSNGTANPLRWRCIAQILVIEDHADGRALREQMLKPAGHEVVLAADGRGGARSALASVTVASGCQNSII